MDDFPLAIDVSVFEKEREADRAWVEVRIDPALFPLRVVRRTAYELLGQVDVEIVAEGPKEIVLHVTPAYGAGEVVVEGEEEIRWMVGTALVRAYVQEFLHGANGPLRHRLVTACFGPEQADVWAIFEETGGGILAAKGSGQEIAKIEPEIELYTVTRRYTYNRLLEQVQRLLGSELLPDYGAVEFRAAWDRLRFPASDRMLALGSGQAALIQALEPSVVADFDQSRLERVLSIFPEIDFEWAVGMRLLCPDAHFDRVVVSDFWRGLNRICLGRLLLEAVRVSREVFVLSTAGFRPVLPDGHPWHAPEVLERVCGRLGLTCVPECGEMVWRVAVTERESTRG